MAYSYTLTNLLLSVRTLLSEVTENFWSDTVLTSYINEGQRKIAEMGGCYRTIKNVQTTALIRTVAFTGYKCLAIEYNDVSLIKIVPVMVGHCKLDGTGPQYWYEFNNNVCIEPIPIEPVTLTLYVADVPTDLTTGGSIPSIPYYVCNLLVYYAVAKAMEQDGKHQIANQFMGMFLNELEFLTKDILPNIPDTNDDLRFF